MFFFFFNNEKIRGITLANYILERAECRGAGGVSNLKLQKILYYVQGYYTAKYGHPLFPDEIHAWRFGPAVPDVYYEFSRFGSDPLKRHESADMSALNSEEMDLVNSVIDAKLAMTTMDLVRASVSEPPFLRVTENNAYIKPYTVVSIDDIKEYFATLI